MAIKRYKPTSPARRFMSVSAFDEITSTKPERSLLDTQSKSGGRNNNGRITVRHIGGGKVAEIQYDPNRTANIALLHYADGAKAYILAPVGLNKGDVVMSGSKAEIKVGNCLPIENIPVGSLLHNIELHPGKGGQIARAAGQAAQLMAKESKYAILRLPSGEMRYVLLSCRATIGQVGNLDHEIVSIGKAGRHRHMGVKPTVRGVVMNPCDHPHGGGEGKSPIGMPSPVTPWGKPALGYKTRKKKNRTNKFIIKRAN